MSEGTREVRRTSCIIVMSSYVWHKRAFKRTKITLFVKIIRTLCMQIIYYMWDIVYMREKSTATLGKKPFVLRDL